MKPSTAVRAYKFGAAVARGLPEPVATRAARFASGVSARCSAEKRFLVERNLRRVLGPDIDPRELDRLVRETFASYGRYWLESFRLPDLTAAEVDVGFTESGYEHIVASRRAGFGPIIALPHLGGWEWAAFWLAMIPRVPVTAVVEPIEPQELFDWFAEYRRSLGMSIVPLGPDAGAYAIRAIKQGHVLCLLCDRDIAGGGVEVEFFGERTTLPAGPATLALRTGAPILPTAVYFRGPSRHTEVGPPLPVERQGRLRDDVARVTQLIALELERMIRVAPDQWHLMQPNWPSDHLALAARRGGH